MTIVSIEEAKDRLAELARLVEEGETVVVTRDGEPLLDLVPHQLKLDAPKGGLNFEALREYKRKHGIDRFFEDIPENFDDPLPEDLLLRPLPD